MRPLQDAQQHVSDWGDGSFRGHGHSVQCANGNSTILSAELNSTLFSHYHMTVCGAGCEDPSTRASPLSCTSGELQESVTL
ncbi:Hypothetical predicted protein [Podarcis lilfordi]|uniref:Uncharacterized protein n=1 Tax=Podarcis lilfordi TaxID=74358 RepID=A0AA35KTN9_9SAUR|nr:Hypothetical predicted protein [Podarcis lilfordi]